MEEIRVLLFDEEPLMGALISSILNDEDDLNVVNICTTLLDALEEAAGVDVVVVSTSVPDQGAFELVRTVNSNEYECGVVVMGLGDSEKELLAYIEAGIDAYVPKEGGVEDLLTNIRAAANSEAHASPEVVSLLMARIAELAQLCDEVGIQIDGVPDLTDREAGGAGAPG